MPTIEITGVGDIEVDESFLTKSPTEQQAIVDAIAAQVRGSQPRGASTRAQLEAVLKEAFPNAQISGGGRTARRNSEVGGAKNSYHLDDMALDIRPMKGVSAEQIRKAFADRGIELNEALDESDHIHISWAGDGEPEAEGPADHPPAALPVPKAIAPKAKPTRAPQNVVTRHMGALNEGIADVAGFPVDLANSALGLVGLSSEKPFLGSDSIRNLLHKAGVGQTDETYDPQSGIEKYTQSAARGVGQSVLPGLGVEAYAGRQAIRKLPEVAKAGLAELRAGIGSGVGSQAARDIAPGNPVAEFAGSLIGGIGGAAASKGTVDAVKAAKVKRFVTKQLKENPYAAYDAEIVEDLKRLTTDRALSPTDPKGRAKVTVKDVNNLEQSYQGRYKDMINGLELPTPEKLKLKNALDGDYTMPVAEVDALRGTPQGNAVADAITMTQRVRALTPEVKRAGGVLRAAADIGATAVGAATHGPLGALAGRGVGSILRRSVDGEAARVNSAERLLKRSKAYSELQKAAGPSGARASKDELWNAYEAATTAKADAKAAKLDAMAEAQRLRQLAKAESDAKVSANKRTSIENDKDNIIPGGGYRGYLYENTGLAPQEQDIGALQMLMDGKISPEQFKAHLANPKDLMRGGGGLAILDRLKANPDLPRDPNWKPPQPAPSEPLGYPGVDASGEPIRNPIAYAATARGNQERQTLEHAASLTGKAPEVNLPAMPGGDISQQKLGELTAQFRANYGRDPDPTSMDDFNKLFGIKP